ncbi:MAG: hypothetical protein IT348_19375 [Candidatus Eisenbacteria bacterium]|nr:hypothetical protein [Candidatus Eisenbacteria bacterium]
MEDQLLTLGRILGAADALWRPVRDYSGPAPGNVYTMRQRYQRSGLPWGAAGKTDVARKAAERSVEKLAEKGLVDVFHHHRAKQLDVRLTTKGYAEARDFAGAGSLAQAWPAMQQIAERSTRPAKLLTDCWVSEVDLVGSTEKDPRAAFEVKITPVLHLRYVVTLSTVHRETRYALTSLGWDALAHGRPDESSQELCSITAGDAYQVELRAMFARLSVSSGGRHEIGSIPLPVHMGGVELTESYDPEQIDAPAEAYAEVGAE